MNTKQIRFVKTIIDYIVKNGTLKKELLQEEPFKSIGSITELFPMDRAVKIVGIIDRINQNAGGEVGA